MRFCWTSVVCLLLSVASHGAAGTERSLQIPFIEFEPELDDFRDMALPRQLEGKLARVGDFVQRTPHDGQPPTHPTVVYVAYDRKNLYSIFLAFDPEVDRIRANMAPRGDNRNDDQVNIMIDTDNDQRRAYIFVSNPLGIQWDGQFTEGQGFDASFEALWHAEGKLTDQGYVVKITIPFLSLRFPDTKQQTWRVMFNRTIQRLSEESFWPHYSLALEGRLNQAAVATGIQEISPGRNIQLVPFGFFRDFKLEQEGADGSRIEDDSETSIGLDAKMVLKDALVLDLTANPDFSQIESDEPQVTVNQRFEVFFPERRPFFLENTDVFTTPTNLVFTRRIADPGVGVKLTGKQSAYAIGLLLTDDQAPGKEAAPGDTLEGESAGVGVMRVSRDISEQSKIGLLLTDRELADGHNRVGAIDGRFKLNENWVAQFQAAGSSTKALVAPTGTAYEEFDGASYNLQFDRSGTHFTNHTHFLYTSPGFRTELGFLGGIQRPDSVNFHDRVAYTFRPTASSLTEWGPRLFYSRVLDTRGNGLDWTIEPEIRWSWTGGTSVELAYERTEEKLLRDEFPVLEEPLSFSQESWSVEFETARFTRLGFDVSAATGSRINFVPPDGAPPELADFVSGEAGLLWRPIPPLRIDLAYLFTELEDRDGAGRIFTNTIGRVRANWQFTKELSLRLIADFEEIDPVPGGTALTDDQIVTYDVLLRYLWNPWWALYVGYNESARDSQEFDATSNVLLDASEDGRQLFVKFSYLFQL